jgi:hypothetical protein
MPGCLMAEFNAGSTAAERVTQAAGHPRRFLLPELPAEGLSRWFPAARVY